MNIKQCVESLSMPLPEDILKRKWAGDLAGAVKAIDRRLQEELPDMLRARLVCEKERIRRLPTQYPWNREQALEKALDTMEKIVRAVDEAGYGDLTLCPETMGKIGQLGTLDEVLTL